MCERLSIQFQWALVSSATVWIALPSQDAACAGSCRFAQHRDAKDSKFSSTRIGLVFYPGQWFERRYCALVLHLGPTAIAFLHLSDWKSVQNYPWQILRAWSAQKESVSETALTDCRSIIDNKAVRLLLKREDSQRGFCFHVRGMINLLLVRSGSREFF